MHPCPEQLIVHMSGNWVLANNNEEEEEERRMPNHDFYLARRAPKLRYYGDVIHSFDWKSAVEHDGSV